MPDVSIISNISALTVRSVCHDDIPSLVDMHYACWQDTYHEMLPDFSAATPRAYFSDLWHAHFNQEHTQLAWIAENEGKGAGLLRIGHAAESKVNQLRENGIDLCDDHRVGELHQVYLTQEAKGKKLGHRLFRQAAQHLHASGCDSMVIDVYAANTRAISFYEQEGAAIAVRFDDTEQRGDRHFHNPSVLCYLPSLKEYLEKPRIL